MTNALHHASHGEPATSLERDARAAALPGLAVGALIGAIWLTAAAGWIFSDTVVPWDSKNQFYAFFRFLASALHSGSTPFWNPYHYGGHPAVADPQSLVFAPLFVLWALFDPAPSMRAFDLIVYAHLLIGALAVAAIGRRVGWPATACVLAAALFMFGGGASARLQHTGAIITYGLFPLALLLLQQALQRRSILAAIGCALVTAALALGRNQVALLLGFVLAAVALGEILTAQSPAHYLRERLPTLGLIGGVTLALTALPTLLTLQFAGLSNRPAVLLERAFEASLYPANLATLAVADVFGSHRFPPWGPNYQTVPEVAAVDESFNYLFIGVVPVVIALWFGLMGGGMLRRGRRLLAAVALVAVLYMLGRYTPLFALSFEWVPGVRLFRRPVDGSFVFVAALALLAGHLLADYVREGPPRLRVPPAALTMIGAALVLAWAVVFSSRTGHARDALMEIAKAVLLAGAVIAVLAYARSVGARRWAAAAVVTIAVAELLWWNGPSRMNAEARAHYAVLERPADVETALLGLLERAIRSRHAEGERPRVEIMGVGGPWQNLAVVRGLEATNGYNPLRIGFYDHMVAPGETTYLASQRTFPKWFEGYDCALARALGLEYVVLGRPIDQEPRLAHRAVAELLHGGPKVWIYRLKGALPRVSFTGRVQIANAGATDSLGLPLADPSADRVLIDDDTPPARAYASTLGAGRARITAWRPDRIEIDVESAQGGVLVLHDTYYPGWIAEIDGALTRILRADVLFRAVEVPPGRRQVVFRFAPFAPENLWRALRSAVGRAP